MDVFDLIARISMDTSGYDRGLSDASGKTAGFADKLKNGLATAAKVGTAAIGAATTAVGALTKISLESYAKYEQLVGGVETLFKTSSDTVLQYADNAYKTAGLSANDYMETVTSFSASLLQGLNGDTAAAAKIADLAITDMSDNANKMGTDMELIQNAYQGFAKQNYTMLDNLKLGYGGTQEEMARLINDSGVLGDSMKVTAKTVNDVSFDKVVEAIHVVQTNMGITGTTALEASTTIEGSIAAMKGAWSNLATGIADENQNIDVLINNFVESVSTAGENLIPRIEKILSGFGELVIKLAPIIAEELPKFINQVLPSLLTAGVQLLEGILQGLISALPAITDAAIQILQMLVTAIVENLPALAEAAFEIVSVLASGIMDALPIFAPAIVGVILTFVGKIIKVIGTIGDGITGLISVVGKIGKGLSALWGILMANPVALVVAAIAGLVAAFIALWNNCEAFREFWIGLWEKIKEVAGAAWEAITGFFATAWQTIQSLWENAGEFFSGLWEGIKTVFSTVVTFFGGVFSTAWEAIQAVFAGVGAFFASVWDGIKKVFSAVVEFFGGVFSSAWEAIEKVWSTVTDFFAEIGNGIQSVFEGVTEALSAGFQAAWEAVSGAWEKAVGFFSGIWKGISGAFAGVASFFGNAFSGAWKAITSVWNNATTFFQGIWDNIVDVFSGVWDRFCEIGSNIVDGIWDGISGAWDDFLGWLSKKVNGIVDFVKNLLGIHSPSTVFAGIGENMALGMGKGWAGTYGRIKGQIEDGMHFAASTTVDFAASGAAQNGIRAAARSASGGDTYNFYSPEALDPVAAAREMKKAKRQLAMGFCGG